MDPADPVAQYLAYILLMLAPFWMIGC